MPVFDAKTLDAETEAFAFLSAILHPSREAQKRARTHGRCRADRAAALADPMTIETRYPTMPVDIEVAAPVT